MPTIEELSELLNMTPEKVAFLYCVQAAPESLDRTVGEDEDCSLADIIPLGTAESAEDIVMRKLEKDEVQDLVDGCLDKRESYVVTKRFGLDGGQKQTLAEVSKTLNLSREMIRQIEVSALRKMKGRARRLAG